MTDRRTLAVLVALCTIGVPRILAASKNIPKWKKQVNNIIITVSEAFIIVQTFYNFNNISNNITTII